MDLRDRAKMKLEEERQEGVIASILSLLNYIEDERTSIKESMEEIINYETLIAKLNEPCVSDEEA